MLQRLGVVRKFRVNDQPEIGQVDGIPAAWAALFNLFDGRECVLKDVLKVG